MFEFKTPTMQTDPLKVLERKPEVRSATPREYVRQRIQMQADALSRAGAMAARVELVNEALCRLVQLVYERDSDDALANVDEATYRLRIPAPWGSAGWKAWGLRQWEGRALRCILLERQANYKPGNRPPLFVYAPHAHYWTLNAYDYPTIEAAAYWLRGGAITLSMWRRYGKGVSRGVSRGVAEGVSGGVSEGVSNGMSRYVKQEWSNRT